MSFRFEDFELDPALFELRRDGTAIPLEPQVYEVLAFLVARHDRVVSREELLDHIWPERYISEAALNSRLMAARKAIGDNGRDQRLIKTVHGRGFRFVGTVTESPSGAPSADATPVTAPAPIQFPRDLETPSTSFVGREAELARIAELFAQPSCRLVTVVGPGGIGKSRLVTAAARRLQAAGESVAFVPLQSTSRASELPARLANALGLMLHSSNAEDELLRSLAETRVILVMDNFEQLAAEGGAFLVRMLEAAPGVRVIVTSRVVLGLREEWVFSVGGLSLNRDADGSCEAMRLFVAREEQATAAAGSDPEDLDAIAEICSLVDGLPLAVELAAALTRYLPRREIAAQIAADTGILRGELRNIPPRHRSIPGLFEESLRNLSVNDVRALLSLSVFEGSFDVEAATEVAGAPLRLLTRLADLSLVQPRDGRFSLHPLLRQFARERLEDALADLQETHAWYYAGFLAAREPALGGGRQLQATMEIDREITNIVAAWRWAVAHRRADLIGRAGPSLAAFVQFRSRQNEGAGWFGEAIEAIEQSHEPAWRTLSGLRMSRAWMLLRTGQSGEGIAELQAADALLRAHDAEPANQLGGDPAIAMSVVAWGAGLYDRAFALAEPSIEAARARGDRMGEAMARWATGAALLRRARLVWSAEGTTGSYRPAPGPEGQLVYDAQRQMKRAAAILEEVGESWFRAFVDTESALIARALGDDTGWMDHFERALATRRAFGDIGSQISVLVQMADGLIGRGDLDGAESRHAQAWPLLRDFGDRGMRSELERSTGWAVLARGDPDRAAEHFGHAIDLAFDVDFLNNAIGGVNGLSRVMLEKGWAAEGQAITAFIVVHPASTAFARAQAMAHLAHIPAGGLTRLLERARGWNLVEVARRSREALASGDRSQLAPFVGL